MCTLGRVASTVLHHRYPTDPCKWSRPKDIFGQKYSTAGTTFGSLHFFFFQMKVECYQIANIHSQYLMYTLHKYKWLTRNQGRRQLGPREISFNKSTASPGRQFVCPLNKSDTIGISQITWIDNQILSHPDNHSALSGWDKHCFTDTATLQGD